MLYSWYQDDVWKKDSLANRMINRVNAMHRQVADQVRNIGDLNMEVEKVFQEADIDCEGQLTDQDRILLADIAAIRDNTDIPQEFYDYINDSKPFSEVDMALIQGSFFAPYLLYPEHYGVAKVPKKDLENFTHLWRTFGYYLGINDAFNAVLDDFEDSKLYCFFVMEKILKPCMLHLDIYGVHMAKVSKDPMQIEVLICLSRRLCSSLTTMLWPTPITTWLATIFPISGPASASSRGPNITPNRSIPSSSISRVCDKRSTISLTDL